jgi:hypothetical protein
LFADDISIIYTNRNFIDFQNKFNEVFDILNNWFEINLLALNFNKMFYMQFNSKNGKTNNISMNYNNNHITSTQSVKFLGLIIDNTLSWKVHIDYLRTKLSSACYAIRT